MGTVPGSGHRLWPPSSVTTPFDNPFIYEFIKGLIHWWIQSLQDPVTFEDCCGPQPSTHELLGKFHIQTVTFSKIFPSLRWNTGWWRQSSHNTVSTLLWHALHLAVSFSASVSVYTTAAPRSQHTPLLAHSSDGHSTLCFFGRADPGMLRHILQRPANVWVLGICTTYQHHQHYTRGKARAKDKQGLHCELLLRTCWDSTYTQFLPSASCWSYLQHGFP